ncbi:D-amino acid dehydrogenase [Roseomonas aerophila]|uniref:D-amino acid dehydrogenase n=1 Tax=Teichococcus aerophilus TaxID=1224513 RepID=A0ABR7RH84_9PROT|nr:D-amino acid dehydrogenase [Pseudoroseomonas aerophila]MBC9205920.1 D-amino acid dehydrogenase [Pseudoroseomonas aerophila]
MRIIVLGAGVIGVTSAYWLHQAGHDVQVVERREEAGLETSWGNGAIIHVSSVQPWAAPGVPAKVLKWLGKEDAPMLLRPSAVPRMWRWGLGFLRAARPAQYRAGSLANLKLALESAACMAEIREATGVQYDYAGNAVIKLFPDQGSLDVAAAEHLALAPDGLQTEVLSRDECIAREPALGPVVERFAGGLGFPQDEIGDCNKFSQGLAAWLAGQGVRFHYNTTVEDVIRKGGRVAAVRVSGSSGNADMATDAVVVAMASQSVPLLRSVGVAMPIFPVKGLSVTLPRSVWPEGPRVAVMDDARKFVITPLGDRYRIVGSAEVGDTTTTPSPQRIRAVTQGLAQLFPQLADCENFPGAVSWAGLRPMVPDGQPRIGPTRVPGLWTNTGHGHTGWTMAAGSGRRLAALMARNDFAGAA